MNDDATPLDIAHRAMAANPDDGAARLRFYDRLGESELFLLLAGEPEGDTIVPQLFPLETSQVVLVFDREERLSDFVGGPADFAALSGRQVVRLLTGREIGLGVNFGVEGSEIAIPAEAVAWLSDVLDHTPAEAEERPREIAAPGGIPEAVLTGLDTKLATARGLARAAYLVRAGYESGRKAHLLAFVDAVSGAERALANAVGEALTFSGVDAGELDVAFFAASDTISATLARVGLRFDLPEAEMPEIVEMDAPGMDPEEPPILR
ncbi:SseB family protein [Tropicimonas sp.]|uniref:SseB family protein n=1 Tax=Tropicimonas sp. TaxID=2067044 RepID=UPI003A85207B